MPKKKQGGRPPERADMAGDDPVVMSITVGRKQRELLRKYCRKNGLVYNDMPSVSQGVAMLIRKHC